MRTCPLLLLLGVAACGASPVSYSESVTIELKAKSGDVTNATITEAEEIDTADGNPYGAFVTDARNALGGKDPSRIEVDGMTLLLGAGTTGVSGLWEIFAGEVDLQFQIDSTNDTLPAGSVTMDPTVGTAPIDLDVSFDGSSVGADDFAHLLGGSFKVSVHGPAAAGFDTKGADASLLTTFTFAAFE